MNKKIIFLAMAFLCLANVTKAENVGIDDFTIKQGDTIQVAVKLSNTHTNLTAFQMTLKLPEGLTLVEVEPTSRYGGSVTVGMPDTNTYNICGFYWKGTNLRRFTEAGAFLPRKSVKTTWAEGLIEALAFYYRRSGAKAKAVAGSLKQGMEGFDFRRYNF